MPKKLLLKDKYSEIKIKAIFHKSYQVIDIEE